MHRDDFAMLSNNIVYFDNGATTLKPKCVRDAICKYYDEYTANAHRGDYKTSAIVDNLYESTREEIKNFINAKENSEIVFTSGTTNGMNMIITTETGTVRPGRSIRQKCPCAPPLPFSMPRCRPSKSQAFVRVARTFCHFVSFVQITQPPPDKIVAFPIFTLSR